MFGLVGCPPAKSPLVELEAPTKFLLADVRSPKSSAFPVVEMVI